MTLDLLRKEILWPVLLFLSLSFLWATLESLASLVLNGISMRTEEIKIQKYSVTAPARSTFRYGGEA